MDGFANSSYTGRVSHRQIRACFQRHLGNDFDLAAQVHQEGAIGNVQHFDAVNVVKSGDNLVFMFAGKCVDGDVAHNVIARDADNINRADVSTGAADGGGDFAESAGARREFYADG